MFEKAHPITDQEARERWRKGDSHQNRCQVCHRPIGQCAWVGGCWVHHIIHGSNGRSDEPCNFLLV